MSSVKHDNLDATKIKLGSVEVKKFKINGDKDKEGSYKAINIYLNQGSPESPNLTKCVILSPKLKCNYGVKAGKFKTTEHVMQLSFSKSDPNATEFANLFTKIHEEICRQLTEPEYMKQFADAKGKIPSAEKVLNDLSCPVFYPKMEGTSPSMFLDIQRDCPFYEPVTGKKIDYRALDNVSFECILEIEIKNIYHGTPKSKLRIYAVNCLITKIVKQKSIDSFAGAEITEEDVKNMTENMESLTFLGQKKTEQQETENPHTIESIMSDVPTIETQTFSE